jgi:hypothetical protein
MIEMFWVGFAAGAACLGGLLIAGRQLARLDLSHVRLIPPPRGAGRWQVWAVSRYPAGGEQLVGRYRARWVAGRIATYYDRSLAGARDRYEVRRGGASAPDHNPED